MELAENEAQGQSQGQGQNHSERVLTEFGGCVRALMAEKGITSPAKLQKLLKDEGFTISQNSIRHWLHGKYSAPPEFPGKLAAALNLSEPQKMRLAVAYSYGQRRFLNTP